MITIFLRQVIGQASNLVYRMTPIRGSSQSLIQRLLEVFAFPLWEQSAPVLQGSEGIVIQENNGQLQRDQRARKGCTYPLDWEVSPHGFRHSRIQL